MGVAIEPVCDMGDGAPQEEVAYLPDFTPEDANLLLQGVYGDFPHHNYGYRLDRGVPDNTVWQSCWRWLAAQSTSGIPRSLEH